MIACLFLNNAVDPFHSLSSVSKLSGGPSYRISLLSLNYYGGSVRLQCRK